MKEDPSARSVSTLRILVVTANPSDTARIAAGEELREIEAAIRGTLHQRAIDLRFAHEVRARDLTRLLLEHRPHVLHFVGHGSEEGEMLLVGDDGRVAPAAPETLAELVGRFATAFPLRCVVLNACHSEPLARRLCERVECVVGSPTALPDRAARAFARAFYEALGYGQDVGTAAGLAQAQMRLLAGEVEGAPTLHVREGSVATEITLFPEREGVERVSTTSSLRSPEAGYDPTWYVRREGEERRVLAYLRHPGQPAVLWGPERFGKSMTMRHVLKQCALDVDRVGSVVRVDLGLVAAEEKQSFDQFLRALAAQILLELDAPESLMTRSFSRPGGPALRFTHMMTTLAKSSDRSLVLAIDQSDAVLGCAFSNDFFGMLRAWATNERLDQLRLILAVSATPALLNTRVAQSPFNLTVPIDLPDLDALQARRLLDLHHLSWTDAELSGVIDLVGGHPYLLRCAMYASAVDGTPARAVVESDAARERLFGRILQRYRLRLEEHSDLRAALTEVHRHPAATMDPLSIQRLLGAGLVVNEGQGRVRLRCRLYECLLS